MTNRQLTLQVNVAPSDLPHAGITLRHQLRVLEGQLDAVIYTLDLRPSPGPRGLDFSQNLPGILALLREMETADPLIQVVSVDYEDTALRAIGEAFFDGKPPPAKDCFGAPYYGYFYGLWSVQTPYVLHLDCDMLLGGTAAGWVADAIDVLIDRPDVLFVSPLAGPPTTSGRIPRTVRVAQRKTQAAGSEPELISLQPRSYRLGHVSSRSFMTHISRLARARPVPLLDAPPWTFGSNLASTPFLPAETSLSTLMQDRGLSRLDFGGPGLWVLHPRQRGPSFVANLPNLVRALERGAAPVEQAGHYELMDSWLNAVGPEHYLPTRRPLWRTAVRLGARLTGLPAARRALWRRRFRSPAGSDPHRH